MRNLVQMISEGAGVTMFEETKGIEIVRRKGCEIIMNHNDFDVMTTHKGISLLDGEIFDGRLKPYDVQVIKH